MPTCPGCRESIPYRRLPVHQRYCPGIWTADRGVDPQSRALEQLSRTLQAEERRLETRVDELERSLAERGVHPDPPSKSDRG